MRFAVAAAAVALVLTGCRETDASTRQKQAATRAAAIEQVVSPAATGAAEPFLFATRDGVLLSWLEPVAGTDRTAVRFARYRNGEWTAPRTIIERNDLFVNWADFPSIVEDARGTLFAHWLQKSAAGTYTYDVRISTSTDGGATWGESFLLNRDGRKSEHGFVSLAPLPSGGVAATWLDGRNMKTGGDGEGQGDMTLRYATVDSRGTIASDVELDNRTCECCTTGMTIASSGPVIVYRDRTADEVRDIFYVRRDGRAWSKPRALNADGWKINACPVNGPQIDAIGNRVATAWFTAANEKQRVYAAFSDDGGTTFGRPIVVDDGKPAGRVDLVMLDAQTAVVSWLEQTASGAEIRARRVTRDGRAAAAVKIAASSSARAAGFTRIARVDAEVWFAWSDQSPNGKRIRLARWRV